LLELIQQELHDEYSNTRGASIDFDLAIILVCGKGSHKVSKKSSTSFRAEGKGPHEEAIYPAIHRAPSPKWSFIGIFESSYLFTWPSCKPIYSVPYGFLCQKFREQTIELI
jgi:hypothetical protein